MTPFGIHTIGYERRAPQSVLRSLRDNDVGVLLDVRYRPQSRRPGLSRSSLEVACAEAGMSYMHDRRLGTPPEIMATLRSSGKYDWAAYLAHLSVQVEALAAAANLATTNRIALLCYESDPTECHRIAVATELHGITGFGVKHL